MHKDILEWFNFYSSRCNISPPVTLPLFYSQNRLILLVWCGKRLEPKSKRFSTEMARHNNHIHFHFLCAFVIFQKKKNIHQRQGKTLDCSWSNCIISCCLCNANKHCVASQSNCYFFPAWRVSPSWTHSLFVWGANKKMYIARHVTKRLQLVDNQNHQNELYWIVEIKDRLGRLKETKKLNWMYVFQLTAYFRIESTNDFVFVLLSTLRIFDICKRIIVVGLDGWEPFKC